MSELFLLVSDLPLAAGMDPMSHVVDGRLWFDSDGSLYRFGLTKQAAMFFLAGILTLLFFWSYARKAGKQPVPSRWGNLVEFILDFIREQMTRPFMGTHGDRYVPVIATFFIYILTCNLLGLIPLFELHWLVGHGGATATGNICITAALALVAFAFYHVQGIKEQGGFLVYIKNLFPHVPLGILPLIILVEIIAHIVRPCALAIRLFANMLAGHTMIAAIIGLTTLADGLILGSGVTFVSILAVTALTFLELLVALIQAFVFSFLTTVFLSMAVHPEH